MIKSTDPPKEAQLVIKNFYTETIDTIVLNKPKSPTKIKRNKNKSKMSRNSRKINRQYES